MNPLIRILFVLLFLSLIVVNSFAGAGSVRPVNHISENHFAGVLYTVDSFLSVSLTLSDRYSDEPAMPTADGQEAETVYSRARICSCQILNLVSSNYDQRHIALLAEKTNHGSLSDFRAAKNRIEKEKKHLKKMFYDKIKVVSDVTAAGSCHSMYVQLKSGDRSLQVYEILNADIP